MARVKLATIRVCFTAAAATATALALIQDEHAVHALPSQQQQRLQASAHDRPPRLRAPTQVQAEGGGLAECVQLQEGQQASVRVLLVLQAANQKGRGRERGGGEGEGGGGGQGRGGGGGGRGGEAVAQGERIEIQIEMEGLSAEYGHELPG